MRTASGVVIAALLLGAPAGAVPGPAALSAPNVLVIIADDMGVDKLGSYAADVDPDYAAEALYLPDTPVLDDMAAVGVRFTDAWAQPLCSPTRAAIYTGRYAFRTGVGEPVSNNNGTSLQAEETTLPEIMSDAGYATALFGKWHVGVNSYPESFGSEETWDDYAGETFEHEINPITQGLDRFVGTTAGVLQPLGATTGGYTDWIAVESECVDCETPEVTVHHREEYATDATINDTLTWIGEQTEPWMAIVALHAPHSPFELPPEGCNYRAEEDAEPASTIGIYEEMVECMDLRIGELLDGVHALGDLDDTFVIFAGDNGTAAEVAEQVFDDGNGKGTVYETGLRVPLIVADGRTLVQQRSDFVVDQDWIRSPRFVRVPGTESSEPVHVADIFATVGEIAGADASSGVDSVDLLLAPYERGFLGTRSLLSESYDESGFGGAALRLGNWKLYMRVVDDSTASRCRNNVALFNLDLDRLEQYDLSEVEPFQLGVMQDAMSELLASEDSSWLDVPDC